MHVSTYQGLHLFLFGCLFPSDKGGVGGVGGVRGGGDGDPVYNDIAIYTLSSFALLMAHSTYI